MRFPWNKVIFLSTAAALGVISASLCAPALPAISKYFSAEFSALQFIISLFLIGNALGQFLCGPLSDQLGQRRIMLLGLSLFIMASAGCALSENLFFLLACRFFQGMGSAVGPVLSRAIAAKLFSQDRSAQVQSYGAVGVGLVSMLAIFSSGYLTLLSWRSNFWLAALLGVLMLLWTHLTLKDNGTKRLRPVSLTQSFKEIAQTVRHPVFFNYALCHSITYGLMYAYITLFPFILIAIFHENNPMQVGVYSAYMIACYMVGAFFAARLVLRWTSQRMVTIGIALQLFSGALLFVAPLSFILPALIVFNLSIGIILPVTSASALAPFAGDSVGTASSALGLSYRMVGSLLSICICQFPLFEGKSLALAITGLSLLSFMLYQRSTQEQRKGALPP
ncbi:MAG: MFS transporter [Parachlamydiaceae bacterium]|nr:MFS transporter [Parachlamydiaceae bacterium]